MKPIAPPSFTETSDVVSAADPVSPAPIGDTGMMQPINTDIHSMYEDAAAKGDPVSIYSLTSRLKGAPEEKYVQKIAAEAQDRVSSFQNEIKPVADAGGAATPEGRLEAAKTWKTVADDPQKMNAFVRWLAGDKDWSKYLTGGTQQTAMKYDRDGNQLEHTFNQLGQTISVRDMGTGRELSRDELAKRGGLIPSLEQAIGYQQEKEQAKFNVDAFNKANIATQEYSSAAPVLKSAYEEQKQLLRNLNQSDLTEDQRKAIGAFTTRSMSAAQSMSDAFSALGQKVDNKNSQLSEKQQKALQTGLDALKWRLGADGSIVNAKGETVTKSDLQQAQSSANVGSQFEQQFTQNQKDFLKNEVFKNLGAAEIQKLGRVIDLQSQIDRKMIEMQQKHGTLPFLMNPDSYEIGNEFARGEAKALVGEFNADATKLFADWREQQLRNYPKGTVPKPGELESAFTRTQQFRQLKAEYAAQNKEILNRAGGAAPKTEENTRSWQQQLGVAPKERTAPVKPTPNLSRESKGGIPPGYKVIGKTPDGRDVYRTPEGKQVVEQ